MTRLSTMLLGKRTWKHVRRSRLGQERRMRTCLQRTDIVWGRGTFFHLRRRFASTRTRIRRKS